MKPEVIFIELSAPRKAEFITDITEQLFLRGKQIHIYSDSLNNLNKINQLLWIRKPDNFLPHGIFTAQQAVNQKPIEPIILLNQPINLEADVLILDTLMEIDHIEKYQTIIDFAETYDKKLLQASRERYKLFRDSNRFVLSFEKFGSFLKKIKNT